MEQYEKGLREEFLGQTDCPHLENTVLLPQDCPGTVNVPTVICEDCGKELTDDDYDFERYEEV